MLEKIGLPPKPSTRGNSWVVDASHCQGCSSQFTFINRKHHCRRCGGLFCGSCTQQRMLLRGQGDSPVRICDPCKTLEEAARFEMRGGNKNRSTKGGAKVASKKEDEILNQILGNDDKAQKLISSASCSNMTATQDEELDISRNLSLDQSTNILTETGSATPEELREQAILEKKKYKTLKAEGKPEEALRAFKRGKELERQAGALEISLRKNRRKAVSSSNLDDTQLIKESTGKNNLSTQKSKAKDDISAELKELGWSDMDLHETEKKTAPLSLEGELFSLLKEVSQKPNKEKGVVTTDKSQVIAHKKKALELKRSGNLLEAKEELKRAKILERKIEEEELLGGDADDDSDDEFSSLIRSMDDDEHKSDINFSFDHFVGIAEDLAVDGNFDVTDEDMDDPEIASALKSLGWTEDTAKSDDFHQPAVVSKSELILTEVKSLKREALNQKRAGNTVEAMALLKKAKLLEMEVESSDNVSDLIAMDSFSENVKNAPQTNYTSSKLAPKSKMVIQKELIALKKKALSLRREGRLDESQEELEKAKVLEKELEEMNKAPTLPQPISVNKATTIGDGDEEDVTDQDLQDPSYLSLLKNLGWDDEDNAADGSSTMLKENDETSTHTSGSTVTRVETRKSRKSKSEIQRELLGLKRKALTLRRQGEVDEADEMLKMASLLEAQLKEFEEPILNQVSDENDKNAPKNTKTSLLHEIAIGDHRSQDKVRIEKSEQIVQEKSKPGIHESHLHEIAIGDHRSQDKVRIEKPEQIVQEKTKPDIHKSLLHEIAIGDNRSQDKVRIEKPEQIVQEKTKPDVHESSPSVQQEILAYKRKAVAFKREGKLVEAREELRQAKLLEKRLEEISQTSTNSCDATVADHEKKEASPSSVSKPMSSRDRFKLQQESLGHKRKALKLRREGKTAEADTEFELAKALEAQLEELDSSKTAEPVDDVMVEDFLDPQLLSALQSIGLDDSRGQASVVERPVLTKSNTDSTENSNIEREQLAEKIKSEKVKALNLKRSGKQVEALDALRRAKMYEKKLQLLNSA